MFKNQILLLKPQPFLESLGVQSTSEIVKLSLFKSWGKAAKQRFWELFARVKNSLIHKCVFLGLTQMTTHDLLVADDASLRTAAENLNVELDVQDVNMEFLRNRVIHSMYMMTNFLCFKEPAFVLTKLV
jgi:hypothetical protein